MFVIGSVCILCYNFYYKFPSLHLVVITYSYNMIICSTFRPVLVYDSIRSFIYKIFVFVQFTYVVVIPNICRRPWNTSILFFRLSFNCTDSSPQMNFVLITASYTPSFNRTLQSLCFQTSAGFSTSQSNRRLFYSVLVWGLRWRSTCNLRISTRRVAARLIRTWI